MQVSLSPISSNIKLMADASVVAWFQLQHMFVEIVMVRAIIVDHVLLLPKR